MARRVDSDLLLVGSLPVDSADEGFRAGAELFAGHVATLPDGESSPRGAWVGHDRTTLLEPHPDITVLAPSTSPTGRARHAYETARLTVRDGVSDLRFDACRAWTTPSRPGHGSPLCAPTA